MQVDNWQDIVMGLLAFVSGILGWLMREIWQAVKEQRKDLDDLRSHVADDYIKYDRMQDLLRPLMQGIEEVKQMLHRKVDK